MPTESFFTQASLAYLASAGAGKDGKAYSIKPTDGTGDFTFSRGSNLAATRVGPTGLIEKGRENLILQSNQFDTTPWLQTDTGVTGGQSGYDGTNDAWLLNKSAANGRVRQVFSLRGVVTTSVYAKAGASNWLRLTFVNYAFFDLINGVVGDTNAIDSTITSLGNGWYRCTITSNATADDFANIYPAEDDNVISGTSGSIYIQDAQLEIGLAASEPIESGATTGKAGLLEDEPRFDYSGGATCPSLLLEPSRTQLAQYSEALNIAPNVIDNANYSYNEIASPSGLIDAPKFAETTANDRHGFYQYVTTAVGAVTASVFTKQIDRRYVHFQSNLTGSALSSYIDLQDGSVVSEGTGWTLSTEDYGNGWLRISATATGVAFGAYYYIWGMSLNGTSNTYLGDGSEFTFWGFQAEQASYPTSYIPNHSGGTITRGAETSLVTDIDSLFGSNNTFYSEFIYYTSNTSTFLEVNQNGGAANLLQISATSSNKINYTIFANGAFVASRSTNVVLTDGVMKVALKYDGINYKVFLNGSLIDTYAQTSIPVSLNRIYCGNARGAQQFGKGISQTLLFPEVLSDADCITLTTL